jgi:hypothetical protein
MFETENYLVRRDHWVYDDGDHHFHYHFFISRKEVVVPVNKPKEGEPNTEIRIIDKKCPHFLVKNEYGAMALADKTIPRVLEYYGVEHKYFQRYYQEMKAMDVEAHRELDPAKMWFGDHYTIWKFDDNL